MTDRLRLGLGGLVVLVLAGVLWGAFNAPRNGEITDVAAALEAWARFASNGDAKELAGYFVVDGPQYQQLSREAAADRPWDGRDYQFQLAQAEVVGPGLVTGTVTVRRDGEVTMTAGWEFDLRLVGGRWQIWTVRTVN
ncbi:MAG TPA: hypothetical protein VJR05_13545 [Acidimicrobiia bacterium]|nr:hypothetical protein [Acidimicrobiia bacterium]